MRVLFYGTPDFALPTLDMLLVRHEVVGVVTQPDRPGGRGQRVLAPPVKGRAVRAGIPVLQPVRLRDPGWAERLSAYRADVAVVVAFGQILPKPVLDVPGRGSINVHASLLPRYRGAAPIAWAIIRGETETGITTFRMDAGMDTGDLLLQSATAIGPDETAGDLARRLATLGADVLARTLSQLDGLRPTPQDHSAATPAPRLRKEDGWLQLADSASALASRVRGCNPWPGAVLRAPGGRVLVWRAVARPAAQEGAPGTLVAAGGELGIATGSGVLVPLEVQPENRRAMTWADYLRGARLGPGAVVASIA